MSGRAPPSSASPVVAALHRRVAAEGISGYRLAKLAGLPHRTVQRFLAGKNAPTITTIEAIAKALGVTISVQELNKRRG